MDVYLIPLQKKNQGSTYQQQDKEEYQVQEVAFMWI